jgi:ankyrin repeat protein
MRNLALNCLTWTFYARRPLELDELQDALAISSDCKVKKDLQIDSPQVILEACGNLLEEVNHSIRPIHYTVQEFFKTAVQGLSQQTIRAQLLDLDDVHRRLSLACLAYIRLAAFNEPAKDAHSLFDRVWSKHFVLYACQSFDYHISNCAEPPRDVINQLETLLQQESMYLAAILQIIVLRDYSNFSVLSQRFNGMNFLVVPATIVYSSSLYHVPVIRQRYVGQTPPAFALHLAASAGITNAVHRLLEAGRDINEIDATGGTPLYYACHNNDTDIIRGLLNKNADVNAQGGYYGNALQAASAVAGSEQIVKILLEKGANVNAQGGYYGNALQAASAIAGSEQMVKMLLEAGAKVNAQGGYYGNALQAASAIAGSEQMVKMLLEAGAKVNAKGGYYGNALQAASCSGHEQVVKMLLEAGAEVNAQGGPYGSALQAASERGHEQVVKILLKAGAEVNAQGGPYGSALQAASVNEYEQVVKMLLEAGAVDTRMSTSS